MKKNVLGIDIGGTNLRGALISEDGKIIKRYKVRSNAKKGIEEVIKTLSKFINKFEKAKPDAIGIGIPGIIDQKNKLLTQAPNIAGVDNFPIFQIIKKNLKTKIPFIIENDASCAALGEYWMGVCKNKKSSMIMLTIGTGLGGGIVINDNLWTGEDGMAGEIGHITIDRNGPQCNCGNYGCLESYVSAVAVRRTVIENSYLTSKISRTKNEGISKIMMELAAKGDKEALKLWKDLGRNLGIGIASIANILNIETVVIGGGLSNAWDFFIKDTRSEARKRGLTAPVKRLKIKKAVLGDDAGIYGASYLAIKNLGKGDNS